jgi:hypothetical protein
MKATPPIEGPSEAVADYKRILQTILENRPSGTRQRLATALGKNRSFVSQITNPSYSVPVPPRHLETIFEICHFPPNEKKRFMAAYNRAHPQRLKVAQDGMRMRAHTIMLPDLGDEKRNRALDTMIATFVQGLTRMINEG